MNATRQLIADHPDLWRAATDAPFLRGVTDGTLPAAAFDRWLAQDHHFLTTLVRAWGRLLTTAPAEDFALLAGGIQAFSDELAWFERMARQRVPSTHALDLAAPELPATAAYNTALLKLADEPYPQAVTAMWAVEAAYLQAWQGVAPGAPAYREYVSHWADDDFEAFVADLAGVVDRELPGGPTPAATRAFVTVLRHEAAFWAMTTATP